MKKRILKKRNIIALLALILILSFIPYFIFREKVHVYRLEAFHISLALKEYVKSNHGSFPTSEGELIDNGYLKQPNDNNNKYMVCYDKETDSWFPCVNFKKMKITYNFDFKNINVIDNKLYDKKNNAKFLIIKGPYSSLFLKDEYEKFSYEIYIEILKQLETTENNDGS